MSSKLGFLSLRLNGIFYSWGFDSQYNRRNTRMMPTRSAIAGMCCAALGFYRGSEEEALFLSSDFPCLKMVSLRQSRRLGGKQLDVRKLNDYHTVQNTITASGKLKDCHITNRYYLSDVSFGVILQGDYSFLEKISNALKNPVWGLWFGRKNCIPAAPVMAGLFEEEETALRALVSDAPLESLIVEKEADNFLDGKDSIPDWPMSFAMSNRVFAPRRIVTQGKL